MNYFYDKNVLLLQGPMGPFFKKFKHDLAFFGVRSVRKLNFNAGDKLFYWNGDSFNGTPEEFEQYILEYAEQYRIDTLVVFGDCRPLHQIAINALKAVGVDIRVFEEGYLRPHYITLEQDGVNANSNLEQDFQSCPEFTKVNEIITSKNVGSSFWSTAKYTLLYGSVMTVFNPIFYPHYQHHRKLSLNSIVQWIKWFIKQRQAVRKDRELMVRVRKEKKRLFLLPLQINHDSQIVYHSSYKNVQAFIAEVLENFEQYRQPEDVLIIKHHPLDFENDYRNDIDEMVQGKDLDGSVYYLYTGHLPSLLRYAAGVITVNSTVGFSGLVHGKPVLTKGKSIYKIDGLGCDVPYGDFISSPENFKPSRDLLLKFRQYLLQKNQVKGNFYMPITKRTYTGVEWPFNRR